MSQQSPNLQAFIDECVEAYHSGPYDENTTRIASEAIASIITVLVMGGLKLCLPELQEWMKLGMTKVALKRQQIEKKLKAYAEQKELDYEAAQKAAGIVAGRLNEENIESVVKALEG